VHLRERPHLDVRAPLRSRNATSPRLCTIDPNSIRTLTFAEDLDIFVRYPATATDIKDDPFKVVCRLARQIAQHCTRLRHLRVPVSRLVTLLLEEITSTAHSSITSFQAFIWSPEDLARVNEMKGLTHLSLSLQFREWGNMEAVASFDLPCVRKLTLRHVLIPSGNPLLTLSVPGITRNQLHRAREGLTTLVGGSMFGRDVAVKLQFGDVTLDLAQNLVPFFERHTISYFAITPDFLLKPDAIELLAPFLVKVHHLRFDGFPPYVVFQRQSTIPPMMTIDWPVRPGDDMMWPDFLAELPTLRPGRPTTITLIHGRWEEIALGTLIGYPTYIRWDPVHSWLWHGFTAQPEYDQLCAQIRELRLVVREHQIELDLISTRVVGDV
jgi:hypothetical protein